MNWRETLIEVRLDVTFGFLESGKIKNPHWFAPGLVLSPITKEQIEEINEDGF